MTRRPNIVFVMTDDHAAHAISAYGSRINETPNLDRLADDGMRFDACFCTNSICAPSRASILTGSYNHVNGVTTLDTHFDATLDTFPRRLQAAGYQTALFGKWHLGHGPEHDPVGFDKWRVMPGQGHYHNPVMLEPRSDGRGHHIVERGGYVTDLVTDDCIEWLDSLDADRPFMLACHHKAPHRTWEPAPRHARLFEDIDIAEPDTLFDDHEGRAEVVTAMQMRMMDLDPIVDLKAPVPDGLTYEQEVRWRYQRYIKDYLRVVAAVDDSVGRLLDWLDVHELADDTIFIYTSDQGFFLGDHGWFDKRLMYEESLAMPFLVRFPKVVAPGTTCDDIVLNVDVAATLCELAGVESPDQSQGESIVPLLSGDRPDGWRTSMYYRYWMHADEAHHVPAHYGVRTLTHKLICYYNDPLDQPGANGPPQPIEWELFDLVADSAEMHNVIDDPAYADVRSKLYAELVAQQAAVGDASHAGAELH